MWCCCSQWRQHLLPILVNPPNISSRISPPAAKLAIHAWKTASATTHVPSHLLPPSSLDTTWAAAPTSPSTHRPAIPPVQTSTPQTSSTTKRPVTGTAAGKQTVQSIAMIQLRRVSRLQRQVRSLQHTWYQVWCRRQRARRAQALARVLARVPA
jgi:hypothetical protein